MYNMIEIYEKEMNVDLNKIDNYFESAMALYEATANIYDDDADMLYEAASDVKEKIKKAFTAIIEAIKSFFRKCQEAIRDKLYEREFKKALSDLTKYTKKMGKQAVKNGIVTKNKYKATMKKMNELSTAYAKIGTMIKSTCKDIIRAKTYEDAEKITNNNIEKLDKYIDKLDDDIRLAVEELFAMPEMVGMVADISDIKRLNSELSDIMSAADDHISELKEAAISVSEEIHVKDDENDTDESDSTETKKASLLQKLASKLATVSKKLGSIITNFCMKVIGGVQRFIAKAKSENKDLDDIAEKALILS